MTVFLSPESWVAIAALTALEIVLGIDNLVFVAIVSDSLPEEQQLLGRRLGLSAALATRLVLLLALSWLLSLQRPFLSVLKVTLSGKALILLAGGLFLIAKSTWEIYAHTELSHEGPEVRAARAFGLVIAEIALLDMVFSLDSVITAVGMVRELPLMITAIVIAMVVMILAAEPVSGFIEDHPSLRILALAFLLLIGVLLVAEGMGRHLEKGYIYFAMGFSLLVELVNMRYQANRERRAASGSANETGAA